MGSPIMHKVIMTMALPVGTGGAMAHLKPPPVVAGNSHVPTIQIAGACPRNVCTYVGATFLCSTSSLAPVPLPGQEPVLPVTQSCPARSREPSRHHHLSCACACACARNYTPALAPQAALRTYLCPSLTLF